MTDYLDYGERVTSRFGERRVRALTIDTHKENNTF
jgi:hypothetical protein